MLTTLRGEYYGRDAIEAIVGQENCVGIRIYYALDESMMQKLVLVDVDVSENDLYIGASAEKGLVFHPAFGAYANPLNS